MEAQAGPKEVRGVVMGNAEALGGTPHQGKGVSIGGTSQRRAGPRLRGTAKSATPKPHPRVTATLFAHNLRKKRTVVVAASMNR